MNGTRAQAPLASLKVNPTHYRCHYYMQKTVVLAASLSYTKASIHFFTFPNESFFFTATNPSALLQFYP